MGSTGPEQTALSGGEAHHLIGSQGEQSEHEMAVDLCATAHADVAGAEFVLGVCRIGLVSLSNVDNIRPL